MTHEGRMARGKANFEAGKLLNNEDTKYYLANKTEEKVEETEPKKTKKKTLKEGS